MSALGKTYDLAGLKGLLRQAKAGYADQAVQILGGYGYIKDYPVEKYYRDVKLCTIGEGTSEIQKTIISKRLLSDYRM